jgi:zinc transporter 11
MIGVSSTDLHPVFLGLLGTLFTWGMTAAGAAVVFFTTRVNASLMNLFFGFAAGVMLAASCFGLILPSIEISEQQPWSSSIAWLPAAVGFLLGVASLKLVNHFLPHFHPKIGSKNEYPHCSNLISDLTQVVMHDSKEEEMNTEISKNNDKQKESAHQQHDSKETINPRTESIEQGKECTEHAQEEVSGEEKSDKQKEKENDKITTWNRTMLLIIAITLHNFPEGLAVGVGFGAIRASSDPGKALRAAIGLALGIGIQNFPEGLSVSMPLRREGYTRFWSFFHGQLSGLVEPLGGVIGAAAVMVVEPLLPFALSFAAGAMVYVVVEELIPESQKGNTNIATWGTIMGFTIMMVLDVALG